MWPFKKDKRLDELTKHVCEQDAENARQFSWLRDNVCFWAKASTSDYTKLMSEIRASEQRSVYCINKVKDELRDHSTGRTIGQQYTDSPVLDT